MKHAVLRRISGDLIESRISWKIAISFIPIAFLTYLFHEFGHWVFGEFTGNKMSLSLNNSAPVARSFTSDSAALWSAIGGPAFTILQALVSLVLVGVIRSALAWSFLFFAVFSRFFTILLGGFRLQDEYRISTMLEINDYSVATIVLLILFLILLTGSMILKINPKGMGYYTILSTLAMLAIIGIYTLTGL